MSNTTVKWVSPTGYTVMHEDAEGAITYTFPSEPHPQLPVEDTSNKGLYGLKAAVESISESDMPDALAMAV